MDNDIVSMLANQLTFVLIVAVVIFGTFFIINVDDDIPESNTQIESSK